MDGKFQQKYGNIRQNQTEILEIKKKPLRELKNAFNRIIADSTQPRKESGNLMIG